MEYNGGKVKWIHTCWSQLTLPSIESYMINAGPYLRYSQRPGLGANGCSWQWAVAGSGAGPDTWVQSGAWPTLVWGALFQTSSFSTGFSEVMRQGIKPGLECVMKVTA